LPFFYYLIVISLCKQIKQNYSGVFQKKKELKQKIGIGWGLFKCFWSKGDGRKISRGPTKKKQDQKIAPLSFHIYFISIMYENPGGMASSADALVRVA